MKCAYDHDEVFITREGDDITWKWIGDSGFTLVQRDVLEDLLDSARMAVRWRRYVLEDDENSNAGAYRLGVEEGIRQGMEVTVWSESATRESYLSGIRVALEHVDKGGRAANQLLELLEQEEAK